MQLTRHNIESKLKNLSTLYCDLIYLYSNLTKEEFDEIETVVMTSIEEKAISNYGYVFHLSTNFNDEVTKLYSFGLKPFKIIVKD